MGQVPFHSAGLLHSFDVSKNLCLDPQFYEWDLDMFLSLFEWVAESRDWSDAERTLLLQCILTGKAQEACTLLSAIPKVSVKAAVLKASKLVSEKYCLKFRSWEKSGKQMHMEFARELVTHFNHWCTSLNVHTCTDLCDLIVLVQFKNSVPSHIATYIPVNEHKVKTAAEAAILVDENVLMHHGDHEYRAWDDVYSKGVLAVSFGPQVNSGRR